MGGPDRQDGQPPGTVWVGAWPAELVPPVLLQLAGSPENICEQACQQAIAVLAGRLTVLTGGRRALPPLTSQSAPPPLRR